MEGGLISLPVEILCVNAKEIQGDPDKIRLPLILPFSHTCQKLRGAALSFSGLWTTISSDFTKPLLETYLTRSQNLSLNVIIHVDWDYKTQNMLSSLEQFILHVAQHSNRWGAFILHMAGYHPNFLQFISRCTRLLPELQTLAIHLKDAYFEDDDSILNNDPRFYTSWAMPNLRQFTFENFIPRGRLLRTVTSVTGIIRPYGFINSPDKLLNFLGDISQIRILKLVLEDCHFDDTESQHVVLEEVISLEVSWLSNGCHHEHLGQLMRHLSFPNLVTFKLSLNQAETWSVVDGWLDSLFAGRERFEKVPCGFYLSTIPKSRRSNVESPAMWRWNKLLEYCRWSTHADSTRATSRATNSVAYSILKTTPSLVF